MKRRPLSAPRLPSEPKPGRRLVQALRGLTEEQLVEYHTAVGRLHHDDGMSLIEAEREAFKRARWLEREA